jgi:hypothetical protein
MLLLQIACDVEIPEYSSYEERLNVLKAEFPGLPWVSNPVCQTHPNYEDILKRTVA